MDDKTESLKEKDKKESLKENDEKESFKENDKDVQGDIPTEIETEKTLEVSPDSKKNHGAAKDQTFKLVADNNDFAEPGRMKRREQINDLSTIEEMTVT